MAAAAPVIAVEPTTSELRETTNRLTGLGNALSAAAEQRAVSRRRKSQRLSVCISRRGRWGAGQLLRLDPASPSISLDSTVVGVVGGAHTSFSDIQPGWLSIGRCSDSALAGRRCTVLPTPTIPRVCVGWVAGGTRARRRVTHHRMRIQSPSSSTAGQLFLSRAHASHRHAGWLRKRAREIWRPRSRRSASAAGHSRASSRPRARRWRYGASRARTNGRRHRVPFRPQAPYLGASWPLCPARQTLNHQAGGDTGCWLCPD